MTSFSDLLCLFCCPPCPTSIASKLAFLPPPPSYHLTPQEGQLNCELEFDENAEFAFGHSELKKIEAFHWRTNRGSRIACMFFKTGTDSSKFTILYSHGNAVDLGQMAGFYYGLGKKLNCNVLGYDYSGYGASSGVASEKNVYADIHAAWQALRQKYSVKTNRIVLYGQSIGSVPTVDLASRHEVAGVILHSPLLSGFRVAFPNWRKHWICDPFPNIEKVPRIASTVLVIHGTDDEVIDFSHGLTIYERCPLTTEPLWVQGAGHNDIELYEQYLRRLYTFVNEELGNLRPSITRRPLQLTNSKDSNKSNTSNNHGNLNKNQNATAAERQSKNAT